MTDPTPDRHREARAKVRPIVAHWFDTGYENGRLDANELTDRVLAALSPAGPEEPREGLREAIYLAPKLRLTGEQVAGITGGFSASDFDWDEHEDFVPMSVMEPFLATIPVPDTGAEERLRAALREAIKADLTALAHWSTEDWQERGRGADPIARTINAARDIVDARFDEHDRG